MHIISDLDGTLFDTEYDVSVITAMLASDAGFPVAADAVFCLCAGMGAREKFVFITAQAGRMADADLLDRLAQDHEAMKADIYARDTLRLVPGAAALLDRLHASGALLSVGSSNPTDRQALGLAKTGLSDYFAGRLYGPDLVMGRKKPDPAVFNLAMAKARMPAATTVIIEDTEAGIVAGHRAGAKVVALLDPRFGDGALAASKTAAFYESGADQVVRHLDEIDGALLQRLLPLDISRGPALSVPAYAY